MGAGSLDAVEGQRAVDLDAAELAPPTEELKARMLALCTRLLDALLGEGWQEGAGGQLDGRLCLRVYPASPAPAAGADDADGLRLGAHCDATLLTLLWASSAGLEVLDPEAATAQGWTPAQVEGYGLPSFGAVDEDETPPPEPVWARVDQPDGALLLTLGTSWPRSELASARVPARCGVLHRVAARSLERERLSLPLLVDVVAVAPGAAAP